MVEPIKDYLKAKKKQEDYLKLDEQDKKIYSILEKIAEEKDSEENLISICPEEIIEKSNGINYNLREIKKSLYWLYINYKIEMKDNQYFYKDKYN